MHVQFGPKKELLQPIYEMQSNRTHEKLQFVTIKCYTIILGGIFITLIIKL